MEWAKRSISACMLLLDFETPYPVKTRPLRTHVDDQIQTAPIRMDTFRRVLQNFGMDEYGLAGTDCRFARTRAFRRKPALDQSIPRGKSGRKLGPPRSLWRLIELHPDYQTGSDAAGNRDT